MRKPTGIFLVLILLALDTIAQTKAAPDLAALLKLNKIRIYNRHASQLNDATMKNGLHLDAKEGDGVAWIEGLRIGNGTIEFDVKGKNVMQQSFVGIGFHGVNDTTLDVVYFRPFNFQSPDPARKGHSVQYVSLPQYDWERLRNSFPNKYEHPITPSPQPNDWVHVRILIKFPTVSVFVNNQAEPSLVVEQLSTQKEGNIGFWVGNNSDGDFANLAVTQ
jgi:hypothetical protein